MSSQNTIFNQNQGPSNQHILYFNPNYHSGFELCESIDSSDPIIIYRPINQKDGLIYSRISQQGQDYQIKHIKFYNLICAKLQADQNQISQDDEKEIESNNDDENSFENQIKENQVTNSILLNIKDEQYPSETEIILRQKINKQIFEFENVHDKSVTFCLIYEDQTIEEIDNQIQRFQNIYQEKRQTNIVIVINGKEKHNLNNFFNFQDNINENRCNICYSFEYKRCIFFIINEEQREIKLLHWIYTGIFKHFQSEYFYVGYLSIQVDIDKFKIMDQMIQQPKYCGATGYYSLIHNEKCCQILNPNNSFAGYLNFLNYQFQIDSLAQIKRFHNPFFSYYKWNMLNKYLGDYMKELESEYEKGNTNLHLNSLLPSIIYDFNKTEFFSFSSNLGIQYIQEIDQVSMFLALSNKIKNIIQCNDQALSVQDSKYIFIFMLRNIQIRIKIAEILFLYTFSPYQLFYQNTSSPYLKILLTVFWPLTLFILMLFFVFLVQQYAIGINIVKKKKRRIYFQLSNNSLKILFKSKLHEIQDIQEILKEFKPINIEYKQKQYRFQDLTKELIEYQKYQINLNKQNRQTEINLNQDNQENEESVAWSQNVGQDQIYWINTQSVSEKQVNKIYRKLFKFTQIVQYYCSATVILNIIFTYGNNFLYKNENSQQYVTIFGIFVFAAFFIIRNLSFNHFWKQMLMPVFIYFNMLITIAYSEMYHLLRIIIKPKEYSIQIQKLSEYMGLNIIVLIIFYIVETSMNFDGYIFSIIIFYNLIIYFIDSLMVIVAKLKGFCMKLEQNTQNEINEKKYKDESFLNNYQQIILQYLKDLREKQEKQDEQKKEEKIINIPNGSMNKDISVDRNDLIYPSEIYEFDNFIHISIDSFDEN